VTALAVAQSRGWRLPSRKPPLVPMVEEPPT
jgi:hypothetical protein